jgi:hypothetical protein
MKKWMGVLCVVIALCFAVGMVYGQDKGKKGKGGPRAAGVFKSYTETEKDNVKIKTLVVTVKKEGKDEDMTFNITTDTKVTGGELANLKAGDKVMVAYNAENMNATAVMIGGAGGEHKKKE